MIVDSSALIAIVRHEVDAHLFAKRLSDQPSAISAATLLEAHIVAQKLPGKGAEAGLIDLLEDFDVAVVPFDRVQATIAIEAHRVFGKGVGHPAGLNFGDCFSYALAKQRGEPLLFKGEDFSKTDIEPAL